MAKLFIVRHGETDWNIEKRTQGISNNQPLNEKGMFQAKALAKRFEAIPVDVIYSSDLKRSYDTAYEIAKAKNLPLFTDTRLREMNFGKWEGLTSSDIEKMYGSIYEIWRSKPMEAMIPDGETLLMLKERILKSVDEIINTHNGKNIAIVSHGISCKVLILSALGIDISYQNKLRIDNTGISVLRYDNHNFSLELYNDTCHLNDVSHPWR